MSAGVLSTCFSSQSQSMTTLVTSVDLAINDDVVKCRAGDNLLAVARRHGSHVWFICDGRGVCRTCACRVVSGAGNLSTPTAIELKALSEAQRERGYRLACQAQVTGPGEVRIVSFAEELRQHAVELLIPRPLPAVEPLARFAADIAEIVVTTSAGLPFTARHMLPQLVAMPPSVSGMQKYVSDTQRMAWRMLTRTAAAADLEPGSIRAEG